jgi:predicted NAD-dependent protein-ADP-ribosyltransferase YbiA (DUF1768 family)
MVSSKLNPKVQFVDTQKILDGDLEHNASVYQTHVLGKNIEVVLGKEQRKGDISYYIAYVVLKSGKVRPIGIYEIKVADADSVLDDDGDVDLDKLTGPILFGHVDLSDSVEPESETESESDSDTDDAAKQMQSAQPTKTESPEVDKDFPDASREEEEREQEPVSTGLWIQQYMQNKNYGIVDNEGGGDCLFAVIRDAYAQVGVTLTVGDLRKKLSDEVTEDIFQNYYDLFTSFQESSKVTKEELKKIAQENNALKQQLAQEPDSDKQVQIVERAKSLKEQFKRLKEELSITQQMHREQSFMKNVKTLDQFRAMINTCKFWADTWAISTLERVLNTKFILLSEENFEDGDLKNVLQCGQLNDAILEKKGSFTPDYYIIMDYTGEHYKLITYKEHGIFRFTQLPFAIRDKIVDKCLEKMAGPYAIIPEFAKMKLGEGDDADVSSLSVPQVTALDNDPDTLFVYYSKSSGKPLPGKGTGEKIPPSRRDEFKSLAGVKDWRRKLSNDWTSPIDVDGHQWQSVEHYYQGSKYKKGHPETYYQFTLDSRSELGKSAEKAKKFSEFEPDMDFAGKHGKEVLVNGLVSKFTQHPDLHKMLLDTRNATLAEYVPRKPPRPSNELMMLRKNLKLK